MALTPEQIERAIEYLIRATSFNAAPKSGDSLLPDPKVVDDIVAQVRHDIGLIKIPRYFNPSQN